MDLQFLKMLEGIRNPVLDMFFSVITYLGGGTVAVAIIVVMYWCYDKKLGTRLGFGMVLSGTIVQLLKITFRVDRPWVKDSSLKPVKSALSGATGYSFPSGHTNQITYTLAGLASFYTGKGRTESRFSKGKDKIKFLAISITIIILVTFSRMYLGVHTPSDVLTAVAISLVIVFITDLLFDKVFCNEKNIVWGALFIVAMSCAGAIYTFNLYSANVINYEYAADSVKLCGAAIGFAVGWYIEANYINFTEKGIGIKLQLLKVVIGIATTFGVKELLKYVGSFISETSIAVDLVRYIFVLLWAIGVYPIIIKKYFSKKVLH